ncbi:SGNH/GDSL hydrolase family protein [Salinimicrobium sediminilitoris]|uniref:SGNH/GDSL hydrolase family protein n=1 Tax=Salinimicrobium sediminilitoris TaxID=2876715 RepID=UPI001E570F9F|nr:SGNH/GDSL hydrolase family protein [Salinimicrobium sediminilitoris]MCC8360563.1 SGNH/GDSL hydrolase family protein [Salinimicrobium sediminilitoris]
MKFTYLLPLCFIFLLTGCKENESENVTVVQEDALRYLALGDSYTIGESVRAEMRWPVQLVERLRKEGLDIEDPRIIATTGWTTQDLLSAMEAQLNNEKFDLVSVSIGVNNQYQGKSIDAYREDLYEIFERAISHSESGAEGVFAVSIPDYGVTPFGAERAEEIGKELDEFNQVFEEVASEFNVDFYDITPISRKAVNEPELIAEDDLHPSGEMYRQWVDLFYEEVMQKVALKN